MNRTAPVFYCKIGTTKATERIDVSARVKQLVYEDEESKTDKLTLTIDNSDLSAYDSPLWQKGNVVEVSWGYEGNMCPARTCTIQEVRGGTSMQVVAHGGEADMNRVARVRTFEPGVTPRNSSSPMPNPMKRSDVVERIATDNGFSDPGRRHIEDTEVAVPQVSQARMTDWQLIRDLARREGFECYVDFDGLHFHRRKLGQKPVREFIWFSDQTGGDIISWSVEDSAKPGKPGGVAVRTIDPTKKGEPATAVSTPKTEAPRDVGLASIKSMQSSLKGILDPKTETIIFKEFEEVVKQATDTQKALETKAQEASDEFERKLGVTAVAPSSEPTAELAAREAKGIYHKQQLKAVTLKLNIVGDPSLVAKTVVKVSQIGASISGNYYITSIKHTVMPGFKQDVTAKRDGRSELAKPGMGQNRPKAEEKIKPTGVPADGKVNVEEPVININPETGEASFSTRQVSVAPTDPRALAEARAFYSDTRGRE